MSSDRVFVASTENGDTEMVRALDRETGEEIWRASWPGKGSVPFFAQSNGDWIRSTPAFDGRALYVGGMNEVLVKLDAKTGEELWRVDFPTRFSTKIPDFGFSSSPLLDGDSLFVQASNSIVKIDKETGETLWRKLANDGSIMRSGAFSSPVLSEIHGVKQLLVQTREVLNGLDPETGESLWSHPVPSFRGMNILTPVVWNDQVFTSTHRNKSYLYTVAKAGEQFEASLNWENKGHAYMSSPVVFGDHAYLLLGNGRLTCLDLESGETRWTSPPLSAKYMSLVRQNDRILALDDAGDLHYLRATPESFEVLDRREISDQETWGHLAVAGDELFVRELEAISAFQWTESSIEEPAAPTTDED